MKIKKPLECFKAYDIRGKLGSELDENIAYRIGLATSKALSAKRVVVGFDARESSPMLAKHVGEGICKTGADVYRIGLAGTEEMYWAVTKFNADAGIEVTASHNPIEYNGMKIVKKRSQPLTDYEFSCVKKFIEEGASTVVNLDI